MDRRLLQIWKDDEMLTPCLDHKKWTLLKKFIKAEWQVMLISQSLCRDFIFFCFLAGNFRTQRKQNSSKYFTNCIKHVNKTDIDQYTYQFQCSVDSKTPHWPPKKLDALMACYAFTMVCAVSAWKVSKRGNEHESLHSSQEVHQPMAYLYWMPPPPSIFLLGCMEC